MAFVRKCRDLYLKLSLPLFFIAQRLSHQNSPQNTLSLRKTKSKNVNALLFVNKAINIQISRSKSLGIKGYLI